MPKNLKGTLWDFSTPILSQNKKNEGDPLVEKIFEKGPPVAKKTEREDPLVSPGIVCYAEKNLFGSVPWVNRYNLNFCRTFGRIILVTSDVSKKNSHEHP